MRENNSVRNSVFALFNNVDIAKFPDDSFILNDDSNNIDRIFEKHIKNELICNLFDVIEKHVNPNDNVIERVIFKRSEMSQDFDVRALEFIVNKLIEYLGNDECRIGEFSKKDEDQFNQDIWSGRVWLTWFSNRITLIIFRRADIFELHMSFPV